MIVAYILLAKSLLAATTPVNNNCVEVADFALNKRGCSFSSPLATEDQINSINPELGNIYIQLSEQITTESNENIWICLQNYRAVLLSIVPILKENAKLARIQYTSSILILQYN